METFNLSKSLDESIKTITRKTLLEIRKDIGVSGKDVSKTFVFHLIGVAPKKN